MTLRAPIILFPSIVYLSLLLSFLCRIFSKVFSEIQIPLHLQAEQEEDLRLSTCICPVGHNLHGPTSTLPTNNGSAAEADPREKLYSVDMKEPMSLPFCASLSALLTKPGLDALNWRDDTCGHTYVEAEHTCILTDWSRSW